MIERKKKYFVYWTDEFPFDILYLSIKPEKAVKEICHDRLVLESDIEKYTKIITIYKNADPIFTELPNLPSSTYRFELYDNQKVSGDPLKEYTLYLGFKEIMYVDKQSLGNKVIRMTARCRCQISEELFGFMFPDSPGIRLKRFSLPRMEEKQKGFETSCLMLEEAYERLTIFLNAQISDCIEIIKK